MEQDLAALLWDSLGAEPLMASLSVAQQCMVVAVIRYAGTIIYIFMTVVWYPGLLFWNSMYLVIPLILITSV